MTDHRAKPRRLSERKRLGLICMWSERMGEARDMLVKLGVSPHTVSMIGTPQKPRAEVDHD